MEKEDNKNENETWEDNKNYGELQDKSNNGELQDNSNNGESQDNNNNNNDAELKDDTKDGKSQDIKNNELMLGDNNDAGVMQEDNKSGGETQESKSGIEKPDGKKGGVGKQQGFENEAQMQEDNKKGIEQEEGFDNVMQKQEDDKKDVGQQEGFENDTQKREDNKKDVGQQEGFQTETQKQEDKLKDAKASNKLESSEKGTSTLLKPKRKLVKKSQAIKLKTRKKKPQVNAGKDEEGSAKNMCAGQGSKLEQNSGERPLEDLQAEQNDVKDVRKRAIEDEPPFKIIDTAEQNKQKKRLRIGKDKDGVDCAKNSEGKQMIKSDEKLPRKNHLAEMDGGEDTQKRTTGGEPSLKKSDPPYLKNKGKAIKLERGKRKQRFREKHSKSREVVENHRDKATNGERGKSVVDEVRKERHNYKGKSQTNDTRKEKLGGLIFMCSGKTKPDCFRYRVMGVSQSKKDIVMGVRPGIKLFLFDFDLKLLYGIYTASSCGGVKLEPRAFGGAFPFQVKFTIDKDCFPLPESVFKKAIKDNYDQKNKFKTELTIRQVRKLRELFRPVGLRSLHPAHSPPRKTARDNDLRDSTWGARVNSRKDQPGRDHYGNADLKGHSLPSRDRDHRLSYPDSSLVQHEEIPRDLFLTEKEYRAYGLQGERRNVTPTLAKSALEIYCRDYGRENHLDHRESSYKESIPARPDTRHVDGFYLNDKDYGTHGRMPPAPRDVPALHLNEDYHAYSHGASALRNLSSSVAAGGGTSVSDYTNDHPFYHYGTSSADPLLHHLREDEVGPPSYGRRIIEADILGRIETVEERLYSRDKTGRRENDSESLYAPNDSWREGFRDSLYSIDKLRSENIEDRLYSRYAPDTLTGRNPTALSYRTLHEAASLPVSSRYSFAGPSYTYR